MLGTLLFPILSHPVETGCRQEKSKQRLLK